jgi:hypothetical protein
VIRLLVAVALSGLMAAQAAKPVRHPIPPGAGSISGRVVDAATKRPLPGATVQLSPLGRFSEWAPGIDADPSKRVTTGDTGAFRFTDLGPVDYTVTAWLDGYSEGAAGKTWSRGSPAPVRIGQDQRLTGLDILLWPAAELTGRVMDERGEVLAGASVRAMGEAFVNGLREFSGYGAYATTDERGEYRMSMIPPARFVLCVQPSYRSYAIPPLSAAQRHAGGTAPRQSFGPIVPSMLIAPDGRHLVLIDLLPPAPNANERPRTFVATCAPSATTASDATVVEMKSGQIHAPDLIVQSRPAIRVAGLLMGPNGPLPHTWLRLQPVVPDPALGFAVAQALTAADGSFVFLIAPSGSYVWDITVPNPPPTVTPSASGFPAMYHPDYGSTDENGYWVPDPIVVGTEDVSELVLTARRGVTVRGTIAFDPVPGAGDVRPRGTVAISAGADRFAGRRASVVQDRFEIRGVKPGRYAMTATAGSSEWTVAEIAAGGNNLLDTHLQVGGEDIDGIVVRVSRYPSVISGIVRDATARILPSATVVVFPAESGAWNVYVQDAAPRMRSVRAVGGQYRFDGLPPGDYRVAAIEDSLMVRWPDPALLATLAASAQRVVLQSGDTRTIDLVKR